MTFAFHTRCGTEMGQVGTLTSELFLSSVSELFPKAKEAGAEGKVMPTVAAGTWSTPGMGVEVATFSIKAEGKIAGGDAGTEYKGADMSL